MSKSQIAHKHIINGSKMGKSDTKINSIHFFTFSDGEEENFKNPCTIDEQQLAINGLKCKKTTGVDMI